MGYGAVAAELVHSPSLSFHLLQPLPRLVEMCDLHLGVLYGSLGFECRTRTGLEENGSGIPRNYKSTPGVSNRCCKQRRFRFLLESNDGIYMILRPPII